ncbi:DUF1674 domain-containing protein [Hoeflea poritis]|uniref:DUF1674 domain-containing protein n=1 Tax=Hoeflea poritis TaxID=2993659 RepID=A0ABT4VL27_9HYPH|nr:DUF1674 domain-containing protein [Hoeflea poritis]MDA4845406.1 DUF1674 domain-containing protein [Hoeflea poritis]
MGDKSPSETEIRDDTDFPETKRRFEDLPPAAQRALQEAEARRLARGADKKQPREIGGRGGEDPARFGDWEIDGRAIDF